MYVPSLRLLRQVVCPNIDSIGVETVKISASPSRVYRVHLTYRCGHSGVPSVIVKAIAPRWTDDPHGPDRERFYYSRLQPQLGLKQGHLYCASLDPTTESRVLVMEDLAKDHRFPAPTHLWTPDEARCMLRTYAQLHVRGRDCLAAEGKLAWLLPRYETRVLTSAILPQAEELVRQCVWPPLPGLDRLLERTLSGIALLGEEPATLLHNDVYPPNAALPRDLSGDCILVDWEMAGRGLAETDLAYMFTQPFGSDRELIRQEMLDYYWAQRRILEGTIPPLDERRERQRHADAVLALWLVPVALRVVSKPYPPGSRPRAYWDSMFGVLHHRLRRLCERETD